MAELDSNYYSLKSRMASNEQSQSAAQSAIDDLEDKIDRLNEAYDAIDSAKESIKSIRKDIRKMPDSYDSDWKGENAQAVYESCDGGSLEDCYDTFISAIDSREDEINLEICRLKNLKSEKYGILQGLISTWNNLYYKIRNYFN